ncbi:PDZ domain-containing protein [Rubrivirga sp. IMCC43871]|uniref:PDZ domain-containing protein n=1 Tax=Rubrivirga sp. IMCC43871 TaxID=3391575 RepID=UPI00398FDE6D
MSRTRRSIPLRTRRRLAARRLRQPVRWAVALAVLTVAVAGVVAATQLPDRTWAEAPIRVGPDRTVVVADLVRGDLALAGLRPGDRVLVVDGDTITRAEAARMETLRRFKTVGDTFSVVVERGGAERTLTVVAGRQATADARRFGLSRSAMSAVSDALMVLALLAFIGAGATLFVRARGRGYRAQLGTALVAVAGMFGFGPLQNTDLVGAIGMWAVAVVGVAIIVAASALPLVTSALVRFPDGRYGPPWTRRTGRIAAVGLAVVLGMVIAADLLDLPRTAFDLMGQGLLIGIVGLPVLGLVQKYRRSAAADVRQQMKWVVLPLGVFVAMLVAVPYAHELVPALDPGRRATGYLFQKGTTILLNLGLAAIPLGVLAGALKFRPWDADLWIARSAAVGAATLGLAAVFAGGAEALRVGLRVSMGDGADSVAAALAAVVALVVFNPVREWLTSRADADLARARERITERLPLLLAGRQVVASPGEIGRVAIAAVREALHTDRAAVLDLDPEGWEAVAVEGVTREEALAWAEATLDAAALPACSEQVWEDPTFVLRVPLRSAEDEVVGVLALGTHGQGRGYSTEERKALDAASRSLAEALRVAERREQAQARQYARLATLVDRFEGAGGDGAPPAG